jgi:serine/threonine-protein kinase
MTEETVSAKARSSPIGKVGGYLLLRAIGSGGMADVFLARRDGPGSFEKLCVVKRIKPELAKDKKFVAMFLREARLAARMNHPNIVQIFELGEADGEFFLAMEFIDGLPLQRAARRTWAAGEKIPQEVILKALADAALGLAYAHEQKNDLGQITPLIHRDVSPDNIMLSRAGSAKLLDFGIARGDDLVEEITRTSEIKGKIAFMSPEQVNGEQLDGRSDLWSLGVTAYWLLTGRRPFKGATTPGTIDAVMRQEPEPIRKLNESVPERVADLVHALLVKDRTRRTPSAHVLSEQLLDLLGPYAGPRESARFAERVAQLPDRAADDPNQDGDTGSQPSSPETFVDRTASVPISDRLRGFASDTGSTVDIDVDSPGANPFARASATTMERIQRRSGVALGVGAAAVLGAVLIVVVALRPHDAIDAPSSPPTPATTPTPTSAAPTSAAPTSAAPTSAAPNAAPSSPASAPSSTTPGAAPNATSPNPPPSAQGPVASTLAPATPPSAATSSTPAPASPAASSHNDAHPHGAAHAESAVHGKKVTLRGATSWRTLEGKKLSVEGGVADVPTAAGAVIAIDGVTGGAIKVPIVDGVADVASVATGRLMVFAKPWAEVKTGSKSWGVTPLEPIPLRAGHYTVVLRGPSGEVTEQVDVHAGADAVLKRDLTQ